MPAQGTKGSRLLFTFSGDDLAIVRPFAEQLRAAGDDLSVDFSYTSEPFATQRSDYIRASLAVRIRNCRATVCLFGPQTFADDWVLWILETAHRYGRPIVATPLSTPALPEAVDLFTSLQAAIVPPRAELLARHTAALTERREGPPAVAEAAIMTLRAMRHLAR